MREMGVGGRQCGECVLGQGEQHGRGSRGKRCMCSDTFKFYRGAGPTTENTGSRYNLKAIGSSSRFTDERTEAQSHGVICYRAEILES